MIRYYLKKFLNDPSSWVLLITNIVVGYLVISKQLGIFQLLQAYWIQSLIIVFIQLIKLLTIKNIVVDATESKYDSGYSNIWRYIFGLIYIVSFGSALYIYLIFISIGISNFTSIYIDERLLMEILKIPNILYITVVFLANHTFSYLINRKKDTSKNTDVETIMRRSVYRLLPMHLVLAFGTFFAPFYPGLVLIIFIVLKTFTDLIFHVKEHNPE